MCVYGGRMAISRTANMPQSGALFCIVLVFVLLRVTTIGFCLFVLFKFKRKAHMFVVDNCENEEADFLFDRRKSTTVRLFVVYRCR